MTDLAELLERVRSATGPDRWIDRELSVLPGGPNFRHETPDGRVAYFRHQDKSEGGRAYAFASGPIGSDFNDLNDNAWAYYTASIDAALALTERVLPGLVINTVKLGDGSGFWQVREAWTAEAEVVSEWSPLDPRPGALALVEVMLSALIAGEKP